MDETQQDNPQSSIKSPDEIQVWLVNQVAGLIYVDPGTIDIHAPFNSYGLSSRDAIMLSGDLEEWLNCRLSPTLIYEYPNIAALADYLGNNSELKIEGSSEFILPGTQANMSDFSSAIASSSNMDERINDIEKISDDEAEALLLEKLNKLNQEK